MSTEKSTPGNEPFIAQTDRPELKVTPDTPLSELRVRDLAVILGQHPETKHLGEKRLGERPPKFWQDKFWPEKFWQEKFWQEKTGGEASSIFPPQSMPSMKQFIEAMLVEAKARGEKISYRGGPIVRYPLVYVSFWGNSWWTDAAHQNLARQLVQFHKDLLQRDFMNVLYQYGVGLKPNGVGLEPKRGEFVQESFLTGVPNSFGRTEDYKDILEQFIKEKIMVEPQNAMESAFVNVIVIYLDENTRIDTPDLKFNFPGAPISGFHASFKPKGREHELYYSFVAYSPDVNFGTLVASHEFAEMLTDPEPEPRDKNRRGWTGDPDNPEGFEIGDVCEGQNDTITVGTNRWVVQKIYSRTDKKCVSQATDPIARLVNGPEEKEDQKERPADQLPEKEHVHARYDQKEKTVAVREHEAPKASFTDVYVQTMLLALQHEHLSNEEIRKILEQLMRFMPGEHLSKEQIRELLKHLIPE